MNQRESSVLMISGQLTDRLKVHPSAYLRTDAGISRQEQQLVSYHRGGNSGRTRQISRGEYIMGAAKANVRERDADHVE